MKQAILVAILLSAPVAASSPAAWAALDSRSIAACARASDLRSPVVGSAIRFSDSFGVDVREVVGRYRPAHMKGAKPTGPTIDINNGAPAIYHPNQSSAPVETN